MDYSLLRADLGWRVGLLVTGMLAALAVGAVSGRYLTQRRDVKSTVGAGEAGTTGLDFALALPVFLMSVLTAVQMALMVNASLIVDYAAFCAARSAAVWLPQNLPAEPAHAIDPTPAEGSQKWARIRRAAVLAVMPLSPRITGFRYGITVPPEGQSLDGAALAALARRADVQPDRSVDWARVGLDAVAKGVYAEWFTEVDLIDREGRPQRQFRDGDTVTARVTHAFEMAVPFAGAAIGAVLGQRYIPIVGGYYVPIAASYTLQVAHP